MSALPLVLLTYIVHSSVLLGLAALVCVALRARRLALQEALLRAAMLGGLATTTLQVGLAIEPLGGRLPLAGPPKADAAALTSREAGAGLRPAAGETSLVSETRTARWSSRTAFAPSVLDRWHEAAPARQTAALAAGAARRLAGDWRTLLVLVWGAAALVALARLAVAGVRLDRLLRSRSRIAGDALATATATLAGRLGIRHSVRLSALPRLSAPFATGLLRPEVCLPARALAELDRDQQLALCAHELAHVARRDPAWILALHAVEALAPLQPLNAWARRRLHDLAECLSDDLAVSASARPLGLARSLVDIASWSTGEHLVPPVTVAGALDRRSRLGHRVERLMDPLRVPERQNRMFLPLAVLVVVASAFVTPVVSGGSPGDETQAPSAGVAAEQDAPPAAPLPPEEPASPEEPALSLPALPAAPLPAAAPLAPAEPPPARAPAPAPRVEPAPRLQPRNEPGRNEPRLRPRVTERADAEGLEALARQIEARVRLHEAEIAKVQARLEALAERLAPRQAELERMGDEIGKAAEALAEATRDGILGDENERAAAAARHLSQLEARVRALTAELRLPSDEMRALVEMSRTLAEKARPSEAELREIQRLAERELRRARETMRREREEARGAREPREP